MKAGPRIPFPANRTRRSCRQSAPNRIFPPLYATCWTSLRRHRANLLHPPIVVDERPPNAERDENMANEIGRMHLGKRWEPHSAGLCVRSWSSPPSTMSAYANVGGRRSKATCTSIAKKPRARRSPRRPRGQTAGRTPRIRAAPSRRAASSRPSRRSPACGGRLQHTLTDGPVWAIIRPTVPPAVAQGDVSFLSLRTAMLGA